MMIQWSFCKKFHPSVLSALGRNNSRLRNPYFFLQMRSYSAKFKSTIILVLAVFLPIFFLFMRSLFLRDVELVDRSEPIEEPKLFEIPEFNMNSNFLQESFEKLSPRFDEEMHKQEQADLLELLRLCKYGDQHKKEYMLTKNYYVGNENGNLTDIYINSCFPIEI